VGLEGCRGDTGGMDEAACSGFEDVSDIVDVDQTVVTDHELIFCATGPLVSGTGEKTRGKGETYQAEVICRLSPRKTPSFLMPLIPLTVLIALILEYRGSFGLAQVKQLDLAIGETGNEKIARFGLGDQGEKGAVFSRDELLQPSADHTRSKPSVAAREAR
jgi:hypothetical protein